MDQKAVKTSSIICQLKVQTLFWIGFPNLFVDPDNDDRIQFLIANQPVLVCEKMQAYSRLGLQNKAIH